MAAPRGEIRQVLGGAFERLAQQQGHATWRDVAAAACVGFAAAKHTTKNMVKAGELEPVAHVRVPGSKRPMVAYRPRKATGWVAGGVGLNDVMRAWAA